MSSFKPIDGAKEDFRKYLDRKGVMDALTKAFVLCYDERPENPIERLVEVVADNAKVLGASSELKSRLINTELELKQARAEIEVLRKQLSDLGVTPNNVNSTTNSTNSTNGTAAIATLSAEAEKTVPSSNTSVVATKQEETNTDQLPSSATSTPINTGAIPKNKPPTPTTATPTSTTTTTNTTEATTQATSNDATENGSNNTTNTETEVASKEAAT